MNKDDKDRKKFLEEQLQWCKGQDRILEVIEVKLNEMKEIAEYVLKYDLTHLEIDRLNRQLSELNREVHFFEMMLHTVVH